MQPNLASNAPQSSSLSFSNDGLAGMFGVTKLSVFLRISEKHTLSFVCESCNSHRHEASWSYGNCWKLRSQHRMIQRLFFKAAFPKHHSHPLDSYCWEGEVLWYAYTHAALTPTTVMSMFTRVSVPVVHVFVPPTSPSAVFHPPDNHWVVLGH